MNIIFYPFHNLNKSNKTRKGRSEKKKPKNLFGFENARRERQRKQHEREVAANGIPTKEILDLGDDVSPPLLPVVVRPSILPPTM